MNSLLFSPLLLAALAATIPLPCTLACTCLPPAQPFGEAVHVAMRNSEAVFSGRVLRVDTPTLAEVSRGEWGSWDEIRAYILVTERWKGEVSDTAVVQTSAQSSMCGADLRKGNRYLVYAERNQTGALSANRCSRTAPLGRVSREELRLLGKLRASGQSTARLNP